MSNIPEFNQQILVSGAEYMSNALAINPYMHSEPFDVDKATVQHDNIIKALVDSGIKVNKVAPPENCQDGVFTANEGLLSTDDKTILMAKLPIGRDQETPYYADILSSMGHNIMYLPNKDWYFSGQGDSLRYGEYLLAGMGFRTTPGLEIHDFIAKNLGYKVVSIQAKGLIGSDSKPVINKQTGLYESSWYDIDLCIGVIRWPKYTKSDNLDDESKNSDGFRKCITNGILVVCKEAIEDSSLDKILELPDTDIIWVTEKEALDFSACNLISTGNIVIVNKGTNQLLTDLVHHGLEVVEVDTDELRKNGGSIRCSALTTNHSSLYIL